MGHDPEKALLVVSFGTSHEDTRKKTIAAIEEDLGRAFPDRGLYTCWTSRFLIKKVRNAGGDVRSLEEALDLMKERGVRDLLVQPTHITAEVEYHMLLDALKARKDDFETVRCGLPLLSSEADADAVASVMPQIFPMVKEDECLVLMGHGTGGSENEAYAMLARAFARAGLKNVVLGLVEAVPGIEETAERVKELAPKKVWLSPFMVVAGDHAVNDMAGDGEDSWKNVLRRQGSKVECIVRGMGEYPQLRENYVRHAREAGALEDRFAE